ncbi:LysE family translocator [Cohnella pontilimi]|uniref:LysE family translocator n=1 Tax=Cohnella pontilimi TaxID=2564100 RepID=A0A4U0F8B4_9BACL|nr:LysE family translocator [Cohnella pontilimi]TJY40905.1 LysE family translocator [Cohnella pontilimi]
MLGIEHYELFLLSGVLLNLTPGTDTLYILSRTVAQGKSEGLMSAAGINCGALIHTLFAAFGLSVVLMQSALAFNLVKWIGAAYLIYMGIKSIRTRSNPFELQHMGQAKKHKLFFQGMLTNVLNPKVALFFLAFMPQFIDPEHTSGALPFIILGLTFIVTGSIWNIILVLCSSWMTRRLRSSVNFSKYLNKLTGVIFVGLGIKLLRTSRS